jgi:hypothetical protein
MKSPSELQSEAARARAQAVEQPIHDLSLLRQIDPPPALVARVMTRVAEPRLPSVWEWLRKPFVIEIRISPLALIGLALALAAVFVFIGATLK